jgi:sigma-E factor negative regulatory protein RseA
MTVERQNERDSQLSAMFDGELSAAECELLARRLTRDEVLREQWSRFSLIGAAIRAERGVKLHDRIAERVQVQISQEVSYGDDAGEATTGVRQTGALTSQAARVAAYERWLRFARPVAGVGIAAGVAAMSLLWLRGQDDAAAVLAANPLPETVTVAPATMVAANDAPAPMSETIISNGEPERYTTPAPTTQTSLAPNARLANYVVAHSEYSGPLSRRMALLGLVASEGGADAAPGEDVAPAVPEAKDDAR